MDEENKILQFLKKHGSKLLLSVLMVGCVAVWSERLMHSRHVKKRQDFILSNQLLDQFKKHTSLTEETIESVENILKRRPELHSKWDSALTCIFLAQADAAKSFEYAQNRLNQSFAQLPAPYQEYSEISLLFFEEKYAEAFEKAQSLHTQVKGQKEYSSLEAMNLLRLAFLAHRLEQRDACDTYWAQLKCHPNFDQIEPLFKEGNFDLASYFDTLKI